MKTNILCLVLVFMLTGTALGFQDKPHVTVFGTGSVEVVPDEMFWNLRVENNGREIKKLAARHSEIISKLIKALEAAGIPEDEIQTTRMQFGERWDHHNGRRVKAGFFSSSNVAFKLADFDKYQSLWQRLADFEGMNIQDVSYGYSKKIEARDNARTLALQAAEKKAEDMAKALRCDAGTPLFVEEIQGGRDIYRTNMAFAEKGALSDSSQPVKSYSPGKIRIESNVRAVFSLNCTN